MPQIEGQQIEAVGQTLSMITLTIALGFGALVGLMLWLFGHKLARPACVISGLVLGGLGGLVIGETLAEKGAMLLPLIIGGAIVGALLSALLFRIWMAVTGSVLLAVVALATAIAWAGTPQPTVPLLDDAREIEASLGTIEQAITNTVKSPLESFREALHTKLEQGGLELRQWWKDLNSRTQSVLISTAAAAGLTGFFLGLIVPNIAASLQTALVGALLIFSCITELLTVHLVQTTWLPHTPRSAILTMGLITIVGLLIQWTLFRKKTDK